MDDLVILMIITKPSPFERGDVPTRENVVVGRGAWVRVSNWIGITLQNLIPESR
ncbi:MAG: hypothetical protein PHE53_08230 [Thermoguttaceae bacterium]|nr:hypothetical protein [Thermoguttaceae bacterium]